MRFAPPFASGWAAGTSRKRVPIVKYPYSLYYPTFFKKKLRNQEAKNTLSGKNMRESERLCKFFTSTQFTIFLWHFKETIPRKKQAVCETSLFVGGFEGGDFLDGCDDLFGGDETRALELPFVSLVPQVPKDLPCYK